MFDHDTAHARVGAVIAAKYRLIRLISLGAMGAVYESIHEWTQRHVAVKLLFDEVASNRESVERFVREARASSKVGHGNIVEVLDLGRDTDDTLYLVQELLSGETLRAEIERSERMSLRDIARALLPIIDALDAAHAANIVHRDVKPENIVMHRTARGALEPKLIDFGVARLDTRGARLTRAGAILGTPNYMAPEQIRGDLSIDPRADLWAIGVVLFECAAGRRPFLADNVRELFSKILLETPPPLRSLAPELPEAFCALVARALDREPARRWPSARAMLLEFASIHEVRTDPTLAATFSALGLMHDGTRTLVAGSAASAPIAPSIAGALAENVALDQTIGVSATVTTDPQPSPVALATPAPRLATEPIEPRAAQSTAARRSRDEPRAPFAAAVLMAIASIAVAIFTLRRPPPTTVADPQSESAARARDRVVEARPQRTTAAERPIETSVTARDSSVSASETSVDASTPRVEHDATTARASPAGTAAIHAPSPPRRHAPGSAPVRRRRVFID